MTDHGEASLGQIQRAPCFRPELRSDLIRGSSFFSFGCAIARRLRRRRRPTARPFQISEMKLRWSMTPMGSTTAELRERMEFQDPRRSAQSS